MTDFTTYDAFGLLRSYSRHRVFVQLALLSIVHDIERRSLTHDASKMLDDEFAGSARMNFLDVIEMVCDWWGARKGYGDSRTWQESFELNFKSKGDILSAEQLWLAREVAAFLGTLEPATGKP